MTSLFPHVLIVAALAAAATHNAAAQPVVGPFPVGKPVSLHVGSTPGGANDTTMRLVARHIGKYLPGQPNVIARNTPGAGGKRLAGIIANTAPRDGSELAQLHRGVIIEQVLGDLTFKVQDLTWIGSPSSVTDTCIVWHTARVQSLEDALKHELVIAGTGNEAAQVYMLRRLTGAKIRGVSGYAGGGAMNLAIQRGEVDGRCSYSWEAVRASVPDWIRDKKAKPIVQFALQRHPELPDVPLILDYAKTELDRQALRVLLTRELFGFPLAAPPGVLPEVRDMLRTAFATDHEGPRTARGCKTRQIRHRAGERRDAAARRGRRLRRVAGGDRTGEGIARAELAQRGPREQRSMHHVFVSISLLALGLTSHATAQPAAAPFPVGKPVSFHVGAPNPAALTINDHASDGALHRPISSR